MRRIGRAARVFALALLAVGLSVGCGGTKAPTAKAKPVGPLAIRQPDSALLVFQGRTRLPARFMNSRGPGSVRVTMEVEGTSGATRRSRPPPTIKDVLFKAEGDGRISVEFMRPWPEHPNGQVTIRCISGDEDSSANYEPELWYHIPGAIVTLESAGRDQNEQATHGKEIVLGRYVSRNIPKDIRLSFKAVFTKEPVAPRTKAEPRRLADPRNRPGITSRFAEFWVACSRYSVSMRNRGSTPCSRSTESMPPGKLFPACFSGATVRFETSWRAGFRGP